MKLITLLKAYFCFLLISTFTNSLENHSQNFLATNEGQILKLHVASWNTAGKEPTEALSEWLHGKIDDSPADIVVVGLQEMVDLNPGNIIGLNGKTKTTGIWWTDRLTKELAKSGKYVLKNTADLVGIYLAVFVKEELAKDIQADEPLTVKTGVLGLAGNKGSLSYRFSYQGMTFSVSVAHLAAGQSHAEDRVKEMKSLFDHSYSKSKSKIKDHDVQIIFGDLNFRVEGDAQEVRDDVKNGKIKDLLKKDQLTNMREKHTDIAHMIEGEINFNPTYKYNFGTQEYDSGKKNRVPSWCDRILFKKSKRVAVKEYGRLEWTPSDHKPIYASIAITLPPVKAQKLLGTGK